ncbi:MAG TPA: hypothetical protein VF006_02620 [Longimicrobium sp.]
MESLLDAHGPMLGSDLLQLLRVEERLQPDAARKRLERVRPPITRLEHVIFPRNERFYYLSGQEDTEQFWEGLFQAMRKTGSVYGHTIHAMIARGGLIPREMFDVISSSPVDSAYAGRRLTSEDILQRLLNVGFVFQGTGLDGRDIVGLSRRVPFNALHSNAIRARLLAEDIFLMALRDWVRKNGLASYDRIVIRGDNPRPEVGGYRWDLAGPSYITPMPAVRDGRVLPGFVVADVLLKHGVAKEQVGYFLHKVSNISNRQGTRPIFPILVAQSFTEEALRFGRENFILVTTPANLLGEEIAAALESLIRTLENAAVAATENPEILEILFSQLGRIEGAANRLRGAMFEMIVGHCVRLREGNSTLIGMEVLDPISGGRVEIDVLRIKENQEVCAYECKGYGPQREVTADEIRKWLEIQIPRIRGYLLGQDLFRNVRLQFAFWTSSRFSPDALALLEQAGQARRYDLMYKDGQEVLEYTRELRDQHMQHVLEQFYLHPPDATALRRAANRH